MFTGIIEETGKIKRIEQKGAGKLITIECSKIQADMELGDSVACDGICLTVIDFTTKEIKMEAMAETIRCTTLTDWHTGYNVNLERAMKADSRFDGHIVQGHVDTVSKIVRVDKRESSTILEVTLQPDCSTLIVEKGSIALNGVSLTVASLKSGNFTVAIVGFTLANTNLRSLKTGSKVNIEFDIIGKYINRYLAKSSNRITEETLYEQGY